ncbi:MAG: phosphoribosylanthranilate isomerase, partial [Roseivirga sp.]
GVGFVGEITDDTTDVAQCIVGYTLNAIQIESLGQIETALATGLPVSFIADSAEEAKEAWLLSDRKLSFVLIKSSEAGSIAAELPTLINDGFNAGDLLSLLAQVQPKGIVLEGGNEIRPGYKDFNELADILELLEIDDLA